MRRNSLSPLVSRPFIALEPTRPPALGPRPFIALEPTRPSALGPRPYESGSALIYTLITLAVLASATTLLLTQIEQFQRAWSGWTWGSRAQAAADSGIVLSENMVESIVGATPALPAPHLRRPISVTRKFTLDKSDVNIEINQIRPPDIYELSSSAEYRKARRKAKRQWIAADPNLYALISAEHIDLSNGVTIQGPIAAREDIRLGFGVTVEAPVIAGKSIIGAQSAKLKASSNKSFNSELGAFGSKLIYSDQSELPSPPPLAFPSRKAAVSSILSTSVLTDAKLAGRTFVINGPLTITGGKFADVHLIVDGDLHLAGDIKWTNKSDTPMLVVNGRLVASFTGADLEGVILVKEEAVIRGNGLLTGLLSARNIEISNGFVFKRSVSSELRVPSSE